MNYTEELDKFLSEDFVKHTLRHKKVKVVSTSKNGIAFEVTRLFREDAMIVLTDCNASLSKATCQHVDGTPCKAYMYNNVCYHVKSARALWLMNQCRKV